VAGVEMDGASATGLLDWQLLQRLNALPLRKDVLRHSVCAPGDFEAARETMQRAQAVLEGNLSRLDHDFRVPHAELVAVLWSLREGRAGTERPRLGRTPQL